MILFISNSGESLPIVWRLRREGVDCGIYIHNPSCKHNYDGILPKIGIGELRKTLRRADMVIFDTMRPNERTRQDVTLLKLFHLRTGSPTVFGPIADKLKKDHMVIGASEWTESLEMDRKKGVEVALKIGMKVPKLHDSEVGHKISTEMWWDGYNFVAWNHTIEDKRMMNMNLGPPTGSQNNTIWLKVKGNGLLAKEMKALGSYLTRAEYIGPISVNGVISKSDHLPYFLEFTPRFRYDALYCLLSLVKGPLRAFFEKKFQVPFWEGFASSARISIPPYPYSDRKLLEDFARDVSIVGSIDTMPFFWMEDVYIKDGELRCAGADGIIGVVAARGNSLGRSVGNVYRTINKLKIDACLQYRTDLGRRAERFLKAMEKLKIEVK